LIGSTDLDAVVAGGDLAVLDLHVGRGMGELALGVLARAFVALELATDLQLQPARVLAVEQAVHIDNVGHRVWGIDIELVADYGSGLAGVYMV